MEKIKGIVVALEYDMTTDDAKDILIAIGMIKGVASASVINTDAMNDTIIAQRVKNEIANKLANVLFPEDKG